MFRAISAACSAAGTAILIDLTWDTWPLVPGLAFGHALLATVTGLAVVSAAVRLELGHLERPEPGHTRGPFLLSVGLLLLADAAHAYFLALIGVDALPAVLAGAVVLAVTVHGAIEAVVHWRERTPASPAWTPQ